VAKFPGRENMIRKPITKNQISWKSNSTMFTI
jgi:hypothetical protein